MQWRELTSVDQFDQLVNHSHQQPVAVFKHSTRCSISSMAKSRIEREWGYSDAQIPLYYLDLIRHRDVSNHIAQATGIRHESPQLIVLKNGETIYDGSHTTISVDNIDL